MNFKFDAVRITIDGEGRNDGQNMGHIAESKLLNGWYDLKPIH